MSEIETTNEFNQLYFFCSRIQEQQDYIAIISHGSLPEERKKEIIDSASGVLKNIRIALIKILKEENNRNYCSFELQAKSIFSHHERLLSMIELAVFGNANIQKAEFEKFIKKYPQYKSGLRAYE